MTLAKLRAALAAGTPGPWTISENYYDGLRYSLDVDAEDGERVVARCKDGLSEARKVSSAGDAALILAAVNTLPVLLEIAEAVAARDTFEPDAGWPMGQACPMCSGFGAYANDCELPEQPNTGDEDADWKVYGDAMAIRDVAARAAIEHEPSCAWVKARALLAP